MFPLESVIYKSDESFFNQVKTAEWAQDEEDYEANSSA